MHRFLLALALSASAAGVPAFAQGLDTMTCAEFGALDDAGRAAAVAPADGGMMAGDQGGMMAGDSGGMMAGDSGGMMAEGDALADATAACAAHPDMTVGAALQATQ